MRAVLAGSGRLPVLLRAADAGMCTVAFHGVPVAVPEPDLTARFERLGDLVAALKERGVTELCLAGAMGRPALDPSLLDPFTLARMPALMAAMGQGDDALLRAVIALFETEGFAVLGAHDVRPDLLAEAGALAGGPLTQADVARARAVLAALGPLDVGQSAVAARGQILGVETLQGTDVMLAFVGQTAPGSGGVLVKRPKPGQDLRADMPAIGPETVRRAAAAGLAGIEIAAGAVLVLDRDAVLEACAETGVALWAAP